MDHEHIKSTRNQSELFKVDDSDLRMVNRLLILCALGLVIFVAARVRQMERRLSEKQPPRGEAFYAPPVITPFESEETYLATLSERSIMYSTRAAERIQSEAPTPSSRAEIMKRLEQARQEVIVVGVAWKPPQVVMLLDKKKRKTYHVRVGQKIGGGDVVVDAISRERIVLSLQDEKVVISL
ncbi:MAG: hypothetical protein RRC34_06965 [Lentisphaeria bacterium]|nr:hypothetical protein [Lentisphaeria bacterium]